MRLYGRSMEIYAPYLVSLSPYFELSASISDCEKETNLCNRFDILGTPTLLHGDPNHLQEYSGDKDYPALNAWAKEVLIPVCYPDNLQPCSELEKERIDKWMKMTPAEIQVMIDEVKEEENNIQKEFDEEMKLLQAQYDALNDKHVLYKVKIEKEIKSLQEIRAEMQRAS